MTNREILREYYHGTGKYYQPFILNHLEGRWVVENRLVVGGAGGTDPIGTWATVIVVADGDHTYFKV